MKTENRRSLWLARSLRSCAPRCQEPRVPYIYILYITYIIHNPTKPHKNGGFLPFCNVGDNLLLSYIRPLFLTLPFSPSSPSFPLAAASLCRPPRFDLRPSILYKDRTIRKPVGPTRPRSKPMTTRRNPCCTPLDPTNPDHFSDYAVLKGVPAAWAWKINHLQHHLTINPHDTHAKKQLATAKHAQQWATNV